MKSISLIKVTLAIFVTTLVSLAVSAEEKEIIKQISTVSIQPVQFSELDLDKNGLLNEAEVAANELLHKAFAQVDTNGDATISEDEYSAFISK
jgi:hypothetical protein